MHLQFYSIPSISIHTSSLIVMLSLLTTFHILSSMMPSLVREELLCHYDLLKDKKKVLKNLGQTENLFRRDLEALQTASLILLLWDSVFKMVNQKLFTF